jgi:hypothetical protein
MSDEFSEVSNAKFETVDLDPRPFRVPRIF